MQRQSARLQSAPTNANRQAATRPHQEVVVFTSNGVAKRNDNNGNANRNPYGLPDHADQADAFCEVNNLLKKFRTACQTTRVRPDSDMRPSGN